MSPPRRTRSRGFTLIEVAVVLLILSVLAAVAVPAFRSPPELSDLDQATGRIEALLRLARDSAVKGARPVTVVIDSASTLAWLTAPKAAAGIDGDVVGPGSSLDLPAGISLELTSARARFAFQPDGSAFPDSVYLNSPLGARLITLNPWTGHAIVVR